MRRKVLKNIADTLCQMVVGWRMGDDYERLASMPDGTLVFNLLDGTVAHSSQGPVDLWISGELSAWLTHRLRVERIDASKLFKGVLEVAYKTDRIRTDKKRVVSFDFECRSTILTDEVQYEGSLVERHTYHQRLGNELR
jgi:hypothetical protein